MRRSTGRGRRRLTADECVQRMLRKDIRSEVLSSADMAFALVRASISMGWSLFDRESDQVVAMMREGADEILETRRLIETDRRKRRSAVILPFEPVG